MDQGFTGYGSFIEEVYDMCKAADRGMVIANVRVLEKHGGKSGDWQAAGEFHE